jgi:Flp pilus assembly protein TadG
MQGHSKDRGQVLVIFAGGLVLLMGVGALVVDLGFSFMTRRMEQNVADPAAIAAARWIPAAEAGSASITDMRMTACGVARQNGLFRNAPDNSSCTQANDPDGTTLTVNFPPSGNAGTFAGRPGFVEVVISRTTGTLLGRVVGIPTVKVTSSAVAAFTTGDSNSNSLVALDKNGCDPNSTGTISGTGTVVKIQPAIDPTTGLPFVGGYVHVNSTCGNPSNINTPGTCGSGEGQSALGINGNGSDLQAPRVYVTGTCSKSNNNSFNSPLVEGAVQIGDPLVDLPPPQLADQSPGRCGQTGPFLQPTGPNSKGCNFPSGTTVLDPGVFYGGWTISNNTTLQLRPGIYYIAGGGITLSGVNGVLDVVSGDPSVDARIMIFSTDNRQTTCAGLNSFQAQGPLSFSANSTFQAKALDSGPYKGILLWQDGNGCQPTAPVSLGGNGNVLIAGTIYAPKATVTINGGATGVGSASIQIISYQWTLSGGATLTMPYDPRELYQFEQKGLVR